MAMRVGDKEHKMIVGEDGTVTIQKPCFYTQGWDDYAKQYAMGKGLWHMRDNGECKTDRDMYKMGWVHALCCDLCDSATAPKWIKDFMGVK